MPDDFNIDELKKAWQSQPQPSQYDTDEIAAMLNRKSRNYVKYILWISIAEFAAFLLMGVYSLFFSHSSSSFYEIMEKMGVEITDELQMNFEHLYFIIRAAGFLILLVFIVIFYRCYRKISVHSSLKSLISQILNFKKSVFAFVLVNVGLLIFFSLGMGVFSLSVFRDQSLDLDNARLLGFLVGIFVATVMGVGIFLIYYKIVYGIILRKLDKNLAQLRAMEKEQE